MDDIKSHLKDISEIRSLMEQSTKFISLSGLSGISAGLIALLGVVAAFFFIDGLTVIQSVPEYASWEGYWAVSGMSDYDFWFLLLDGFVILALALGFSSLFSIRMAKKRGLPVWNKSGWHMLSNLMIPLIAGGFFVLIQLYHGSAKYVGATTLIFYGLALLNAGKYTLKEIRYLGLMQIILGLIAAIWVEGVIPIWAFGFGILHIVYGIIMYFKYEREGDSG